MWLKLMLGVCVCYELSAFSHLPESRIKIWPFLDLFPLKNDLIFLLMILHGLPSYQESASLCKTAVQGLRPKLSCYHKEPL
jgi:hypothetical protein